MEIEPVIPPLNRGGSKDLDLIEVLWRQDIDLGIGKEAFDNDLRRELEREREIELQKERQTQKEQEVRQKKHEEERRQHEQTWLADNFTQDGETGEWVPLGGARVQPQPQAPELQSGDQSFLSTYDNMPLIGDELQQGQNGNFSVGGPQVNHMPPQGPFQGPQTMQPHAQPPPMYSPNMNNGFNQSQGFNSQPPMYNMNNISTINNTQGFPQQVGFNANHTYQQSQGYNNHTQNFNMNMNRQSSLEQTWQDLVNLLELPQNQTQMNNQTQPDNRGMLMNTSVHNQGMMSPVSGLDNSSSVLIQNATLPTPPPLNSNLTGLNNSGLLSPGHNTSDMLRSPAHSSGMLSPGQNFNSTGPNTNNISPVEWEPCSNFLFPNITNNLNQTESIEDVDELLPDLITDDELENINFSEMGLTDAMTPTPNRHQDDASSDSAVSMGSQSVGSPEQNDFSDGAMSPFDGLEGATGGHDNYKRSSSGFSKTSKYDPDDYKYSNSCSFSGADSNGSNFSSSSNDTNGQDPSGYGRGHFSPNSNRNINHNHTYPLKPGVDPKDKKHMFNNKEPKQKGPHCRDYKRIDELKVPFSVDQIVGTPVEEFNDMLTRHKLTDTQLQLIRDIRRRGKNKVAAQNCRKRKMDVIDTLEDEMGGMERMRDKLLHERYVIDKQTRDMKEKLGNLYSEIFHSLRDEHGRPYDPMRFSLQQSSDGDVFLVPRNYSADDEMNKKRKNERK